MLATAMWEGQKLPLAKLPLSGKATGRRYLVHSLTPLPGPTNRDTMQPCALTRAGWRRWNPTLPRLRKVQALSRGRVFAQDCGGDAEL